MAQTILLHGGPWHGQVIAIEDGRDCLHVVAPDYSGHVSKDPDALIPKREGTYSRIHNSKADFEWDGWRSHD